MLIILFYFLFWWLVYSIQALVSSFLLDDSAEDTDESCLHAPPGK
jgi:hypothetical protein